MNCYDKVHNRLFMARSDFFERFGMSYHILIIKHSIFPFTCIQRINNLLDQNRLNTNIDDSENSIPNTKYSFFMLSRFVSEMHLNEQSYHLGADHANYNIFTTRQTSLVKISRHIVAIVSLKQVILVHVLKSFWDGSYW